MTTPDDPESEWDVIIPDRVRHMAREAMGTDVRFEELQTALEILLTRRDRSGADIGDWSPVTGTYRVMLWAGNEIYIVELKENDDPRLNWAEVLSIRPYP